MSPIEAQYRYTLHCEAQTARLILMGDCAPWRSPAQQHRLNAWNRVRRALSRDVLQLQAQLPKGYRPPLFMDDDGIEVTNSWYAHQLRAWQREGIKNPLIEGVERGSDPSGKVS